MPLYLVQAEPVAEAKAVAEPVAEPVEEPVAEAKTVEKPQPVKPLLLPVPGDPGPGPSSAAEVSFTNRVCHVCSRKIW